MPAMPAMPAMFTTIIMIMSAILTLLDHDVHGEHGRHGNRTTPAMRAISNLRIMPTIHAMAELPRHTCGTCETCRVLSKFLPTMLAITNLPFTGRFLKHQAPAVIFAIPAVPAMNAETTKFDLARLQGHQQPLRKSAFFV